FSSRSTDSPSFLCQERSVASDTDSDNTGTLTSTSMILPLSRFSRETPPRLTRSAATCAWPGTPPPGRLMMGATHIPGPAWVACAAADNAGCDAMRPGCPALPDTIIYLSPWDTDPLQPGSHHVG